ncbi:MAG: sigma-54-dependent Fis family transcriptional regulator [Nitrospirae bacterium]|nr:sigma-54-dependent Fis family transcriptional regulator [Nitrospirota bacterium]
MNNAVEIVLITGDASLSEELSGLLPKDCSIVKRQTGHHNSFIFFDIDTMKAGLIKDLSQDNIVVAVTKLKLTEPVMEAVTFGVYEIVHRPLQREIVLQLLQDLSDLREELKQPIAIRKSSLAPTCAIVGNSAGIMEVCKKLARLSQAEVPVLITGETGTGKELIAESIAQLSSRFGKPFVVVNCAAVPEALLESELFGFEKGAFTGALSGKAGMLKIADEGTVFFDEIAELPLPLQGKLLRFLQTQTFYPIGSTSEVQVNVRVISATNRDLAAMVREGSFREDLLHRLRVAKIHTPPLRERREDILPLVNFFADRYSNTGPRPIRGITGAFLKKMLAYDWPGNIRELENTIRSAIALSKTYYITTQEIKELGDSRQASHKKGAAESLGSVILPMLKQAIEQKDKNIYEKIHREVDKPILDYVLSHTRENQSEAARILGINRLTLRKKLK